MAKKRRRLKKSVRRFLKGSATVLLSTSLSACSSCSNNPEAVPVSPESSSAPGALATPGASATPTAKPEASASPSAAPSEISGAKTEGSESNGKLSNGNASAFVSKTYNTSVRKGSAHADPFAEQKNACAATWGTWIDGTGCTWPVTSGSVTKNTSSKAEDSKQSDPVVDELTMLRNNVEKATKALATAIATRDNAIVARDAAKEALKDAQSTLLTSKETMEARKAALAQAESLLEIANTNLSNLQSQYEEAVSAAQSEYDKTMAQAALERDGELAENAKVYADAVKAADDAFNATLADLQSDYDQAVKNADSIRDGEYA